MKKILLVILLLFLFIPFQCFALVEKSNDEFVTDAANLLSEESEDYIYRYSLFLYKNKKIGFYVVTVKNLEGESLEDYTNAIFKNFKLTQRDLVILISKENRQLRVQAGDKLSDHIDSDLIDEYIDTYFMPYLKNEEWNDGIVNGYSALYKFICEEYGIDASSVEVVDQVSIFTKYRTIILMIIVWLEAVFVRAYVHYQKKIKKNTGKTISDLDLFLLVTIILANIFVISISYLLKPIYLILTLVFEAVFLYSSFSTFHDQKVKKEKIHKPVKHKRIKKHK